MIVAGKRLGRLKTNFEEMFGFEPAKSAYETENNRVEPAQHELREKQLGLN